MFSLIYWVAHDRTSAGVIYSVLDYGGNKLTTSIFAALLLLMPPLFYLVLFGIAKSRDAVCHWLEHLAYRVSVDERPEEAIALRSST